MRLRNFSRIHPLVTALLTLLLLVMSAPVTAGGPLRSALDLNLSQVGKVQDVQAEARRAYALKRHRYDRDMRSLGHAQQIGHLEQIEALERSTSTLREALRALRQAEDDAIRDLLLPEQIPAYEAWLNERDVLFGSSRYPVSPGEVVD